MALTEIPTLELKKSPLPEDLIAFLKSPEGMVLLAQAQAQPKTSALKRPPHTSEEIEKFSRMFNEEGKFSRIDPKTKQPLAEANEFFWKIQSIVPDCIGHNVDTENLTGDLRINFLIQKYHRDEALMYEVESRFESGNSRKKRMHLPFCERRISRDGKSQSEIIASGDRFIDAEDFLNQFVEE